MPAFILLLVQLAFGNVAFAHRITGDELQARFNRPQTQIESANDFIMSSRPPSLVIPKKVEVKEGRIFARLVTALDSSKSKVGDRIQAVVSSSVTDKGQALLPEGAIIEGVIEAANKKTYLQTDGSIVLRFYRAQVDGQIIELDVAPDTKDRILHPQEEALSKKARLKALLMAGTFIAVPLAIGTGGTSIAITAGAGAVIGGVLADDGKYVSGALKGAWQGSGLSVLDPVVAKGRSVVLPKDTAIVLKLSTPASVPPVPKKLAETVTMQEALTSGASGKMSVLNTHAKIITKEKTADGCGNDGAEAENADPLSEFHRLVEQKNLAAALEALDRAEQQYPDNSEISKMRAKVMALISGPASEGP